MLAKKEEELWYVINWVGMCGDSSGGFYYARERWSPRVARSNGKPAAKAAIMPPAQGLPTEHYRASESHSTRQVPCHPSYPPSRPSEDSPG